MNAILFKRLNLYCIKIFVLFFVLTFSVRCMQSDNFFSQESVELSQGIQCDWRTGSPDPEIDEWLFKTQPSEILVCESLNEEEPHNNVDQIKKPRRSQRQINRDCANRMKAALKVIEVLEKIKNAPNISAEDLAKENCRMLRVTMVNGLSDTNIRKAAQNWVDKKTNDLKKLISALKNVRYKYN